MKKLLVLTSIAIASLTFVSCDKNEDLNYHVMVNTENGKELQVWKSEGSFLQYKKVKQQALEHFYNAQKYMLTGQVKEYEYEVAMYTELLNNMNDIEKEYRIK